MDELLPVVKLIVIMVAVVGVPMAGVFLFPPIARALARRIERARPAEDLAALRDEVARVGPLEQRVAELEERLDFAERLLARAGETPRLPRG